MSDLRLLGPQDFRVLIHYLADHVYAARTQDGHRLLDLTDFNKWLQELADS